MALSDACIETIITFCDYLGDYATIEDAGDGGPNAVLAIHHLAQCAAKLDREPGLSHLAHQRRADGYFLGNLLDGCARHPNLATEEFVAAMAHTVPELSAALLRYDAMARSESGDAYRARYSAQAEYLGEVMKVYSALP